MSNKWSYLGFTERVLYFLTNLDELKTFLGINNLMGINKLLSVTSYWEVDQYTGNVEIKNGMIQHKFQNILQNLHFANNGNDDKSDKGKDLYLMFRNIHNLMLSKLTPFLVKIPHGKNLHFRYDSINIRKYDLKSVIWKFPNKYYTFL